MIIIDGHYLLINDSFVFGKKSLLKGNKMRGSSSFWKGIWNGCVTFKEGIRWICEVGRSVRFWEDLYIGEICLANLFSSLYQIASIKSYPISSQYSWYHNCRVLNINFTNEFRDGHL